MKRPDGIGLFWQDVGRPKSPIPRAHPVIPKTGWTAPSFPNLSAAPCIAFDVETYDPELIEHGPGWARGKGHLVGISVAVPGHAFYFPMRHEVNKDENLDPVHVLAWTKDTLALPMAKIGANLLYDVGWLEEEGVTVNGPLYDVQFAEALLAESARTSLETLGQKYLNEGKETSELYEWSAGAYGGKATSKQRANIYRCPPCLVGPYAESDAELPLRILPLQWEILVREGLTDVFDMECKLIRLLIAMRRAGVSVDIAKAEQVRSVLLHKEKDLHEQLKLQAGFEVNPNAASSMVKAFKALGIPVPTTGEGNPTFAKEILASIDHPFVDTVAELKKIEKIRSTFIEASILASNVKGKIFCQFHPLRGDDGGTRSGRLSSSDPNLQQVPSRDEILAPLVRGCFVPDEGHKRWVKFDYSQIEYRGLAHFARGPGSDALRAQYAADPDTDYHVHTQQLVARLTGKEIPRKPIKNINFGLIYGMGMGKLARSLGLGKAESESLFAAYHSAAPFAKATMEFYIQEAQVKGYITTILGRRSRFDLWEPDEWNRGEDRKPALPYGIAFQAYGRVKRASTHKALNRVLQGSAADQMKKAMLLCWESGVFGAVGVPRLTVHDELDLSDPGTHPEAWAFIKETMEKAIPMRVPVVAEMEVGPNWGAVE